ncbi:MAG: hypothetical protein ACLP4V_20190 [Methylocella sp.]
MDIRRISIVSGMALLALTATASAGPMSVTSSQIITPPTQIEQVYYHYRHHYRHYGWHRGYYRHYGWNRWHRPYYGYGYGYPNYNGYGYGAGYNGYGYGAGLAGLATAPLMTGRSVAVSSVAAAPVSGAVAGPGDYCATPERTCRLIESGWLGTGCSCRVPGGRARGFVE